MTAFIRFVSVLLTASALTVSVSATAKPVAEKRVAVQSSNPYFKCEIAIRTGGFG